MNQSVIRIGIVSDVNGAEDKARVRFPAENIVSDWLQIVRPPPFAAEAENNVEINFYRLPYEVGTPVICVYAPGFNQDGYILGALK